MGAGSRFFLKFVYLNEKLSNIQKSTGKMTCSMSSTTTDSHQILGESSDPEDNYTNQRTTVQTRVFTQTFLVK